MKFNQDFLKEIGLDKMSKDEQDDFLDYVYSELQTRVGQALSDNMTSEQLLEFKKIANGDTSFMLNWLSAFVPMYQSDEIYENIQESKGYDSADPRLLEEYTSAKWLELNQPNYAQIVAEEIRKLRQEIIDNKDKILNH